MTAQSESFEAHRRFLDRYYGISRHFYDVTRKYYLFGRERALDVLLRERWDTLLEVGPGTGRNLRRLFSKRPAARFGGLEASDAMLGHARGRVPFARLVRGFAETADYAEPLGGPPDRILFSYCLSMVQDRGAAVRRARAALAPGGKVVVVDFADLGGLPAFARVALLAWLETFHVRPLSEAELSEWGAVASYGPLRYFVIAEIPAR